MRVSALFFDKDARYPCLLSPCKVWDDALSEAVSGPELKVYCYWESKKVSTLLALHVSSGGQVPDLRLLPLDRAKDPSAFKQFAEEHQNCLDDRKAIVVKINETRELLLAPVFSIEDDGSKYPVFWGYMLYFGVASAVSLMLDYSRMAVVLDLDETLLVANSMSTLDSKIEVARKTRRLKAAELRELLCQGVTEDSEEAARLRGAESSAAKEEELLATDLEMLRQFANTGTINFNGITHKARMETARLEDGTEVRRPVIRLDKPHPVILTRIRPEQRETSMILRPRPFWEELRAVLAGDAELDPSGKPKLRFDVYVCTAAERQYALEVWRLLDTRASIIPISDRSKRIINVPGGRKKQLLKSLGVAENAGNARLEWAELQDDEPPLPLAVVLDDRLDVWEAASQSCILQVVPWYWYRDEAARLVSGPGTPADRLALASENEIKRMRDAVLQLRAELFFDINERLRKLADYLVTAGAPEELQRRNPGALLPGLKTVAGVLRAATNRVYQMPTLASIAAQFRPNNNATPPEMDPVAMPQLAGGFPVVGFRPGPQPMNGPLGAGPPVVTPVTSVSSGAGPDGILQKNTNVPAAASVPAPQGSGPGPTVAPTAVVSLKPVDPRAARRAAASAQCAGGAQRPAGVIVLQPPAPGMGPQPITAFGALASLGLPAVQPPVEPPKRRIAPGSLDHSKWTIEALEGEGPELKQQQGQGQGQQQPSEAPASSVAAGNQQAPAPADVPASTDDSRQVSAGFRVEDGRGDSLEGSEGSSAVAALQPQPAGSPVDSSLHTAASGPGSLQVQAKLGAHPDAGFGGSAEQKQERKQQAPQPGLGPAATTAGAGGSGSGTGQGVTRKNAGALVTVLISQIQGLEPSVRATIEELLKSPETGVAKVIELLHQPNKAQSQMPAQQQPQQQQPQQQAPQASQPPKPAQPNPGPSAFSGQASSAGTGAEAARQQPLQHEEQQQQVHLPTVEAPQLKQVQEQPKAQQLPLQPKHAPTQQPSTLQHRQPSPQVYQQQGVLHPSTAQGSSQFPPPPSSQPQQPLGHSAGPPPPVAQQQQPQHHGSQHSQPPPGLPYPQPPTQYLPPPPQEQQNQSLPHLGMPLQRPLPPQPPARAPTPPLTGQGQGAMPGPSPHTNLGTAQGPSGLQGQSAPQAFHGLLPGHPPQAVQMQVMMGTDGRIHLQPSPAQQLLQGQGQQIPGNPMGPGQMVGPCPTPPGFMGPGPIHPQGPGMMGGTGGIPQQHPQQHPHGPPQPMQMPMLMPGGGMHGGPNGPGGLSPSMIPTMGGMMGQMGPQGLGAMGGQGQQNGGQPILGMGMLGPGVPQGGPMQQQVAHMQLQPGGPGMPMVMMMMPPQGPAPGMHMAMQLQPGGLPMQMQLSGMPPPPQQQQQQQQQPPQQQQGHMAVGIGVGIKPLQQPHMGNPMGPHPHDGGMPQGGQMGGPFGGQHMSQPGQMPPGMQPMQQQQQPQGMQPQGMQFLGGQISKHFMGGPGAGPNQGPGMPTPPGRTPGQQSMGSGGAPTGSAMHAGMKRPPSPSLGPREPPAKAPRQSGGPHDNGPPAGGLPGGLPPWQVPPQQQGTTAMGNNTTPPPGPPPGQPQEGAACAEQMVPIENPVNKLNELSQRNKMQLMYRESKIIDGGMVAWSFSVQYGGKEIGNGQAPTKKDAKRAAAMNALKNLNVSIAMAPPYANRQPGQQQQQPSSLFPPSGTGGSGTFIGPAPAPSPVPSNGTAEGCGPSVPVVTGPDAGPGQGTGGHPVTEVSYYRLMGIFGKESLVFTNVEDDGQQQSRPVKVQLRVRNTQHCILGEGTSRRAARFDAAARLLSLLGVPPPGPSNTQTSSVNAVQRGATTSSRGGSGQDSDSDGGPGQPSGSGRPQHSHHHHHHSQHRDSQQRGQQQQRASSRSPRPSEDESDGADEDYNVLAGASYFTRGARAGGKPLKGAAKCDDMGGGNKAYVADFMQLIAEELDDGLGGGGGGALGPGKGQAGSGVAETKKGIARGVTNIQQKQPPSTHTTGEESSEEEEGELPSEDEGS